MEFPDKWADDLAHQAALAMSERGWSTEMVAAFAASQAALTDQLIACAPMIRATAGSRTPEVLNALVAYTATMWRQGLVEGLAGKPA